MATDETWMKEAEKLLREYMDACWCDSKPEPCWLCKLTKELLEK